jgi:hypothetical protein
MPAAVALAARSRAGGVDRLDARTATKASLRSPVASGLSLLIPIGVKIPDLVESAMSKHRRFPQRSSAGA